jgi:hypothetical protein
VRLIWHSGCGNCPHPQRDAAGSGSCGGEEIPASGHGGSDAYCSRPSMRGRHGASRADGHTVRGEQEPSQTSADAGSSAGAPVSDRLPEADTQRLRAANGFGGVATAFRRVTAMVRQAPETRCRTSPLGEPLVAPGGWPIALQVSVRHTQQPTGRFARRKRAMPMLSLMLAGQLAAAAVAIPPPPATPLRCAQSPRRASPLPWTTRTAGWRTSRTRTRKDWIRAQADRTRSILDAIPARAQVLADVERLEKNHRQQYRSDGADARRASADPAPGRRSRTSPSCTCARAGNGQDRLLLDRRTGASAPASRTP